MILFPAECQVFIRRAVAQNFPPVHAVNQSFQFVGTHSGGIESADEAAHAGSSNVIDWDVVFVKPFQDADVREPHGAAAFERHADFGAHARREILLRAQRPRQQK